MVKKKKTVSFSQFTNWWTCPHKWYRDYILHEKVFEDSVHMSFGTGIHEAIQLYLKTLYEISDQAAEAVDVMTCFTKAFKRELELKKIIYTQSEFNEFIEDGKNILTEFRAPENRLRYFPRNKWELLSIEEDMREDIINNVTLNSKLDLVLRERISGDIRIIDFKTASTAWTNYKKEDFTKYSQVLLYKAIYSKKYNIPLSKIHVEFIIMCRKLYKDAETRYKQSRLQIFKPSAYQNDVIQVIQEFKKFVSACFTEEGVHNTTGSYPKVPGKSKKNCKYCPYLKNGKCNGVAEPI